MKCEYCELEKGRAVIVYEDSEVVAAVKDTVVHPGQITIFPKEHFTIMEMVPDEILSKCFSLANKIGAAVFEGLEAQGTNIIVQNGISAGQKVPHFAIEVIPRREGDGLKLQWEGKQMMEDELEMVIKQLQSVAKEVPKVEEKKTEAVVKKKEGEENYLIKSQRRIP